MFCELFCLAITHPETGAFFTYLSMAINLPYFFFAYALNLKCDAAARAYYSLKRYQQKLEAAPTQKLQPKFNLQKLIKLRKQRFSCTQRFHYRKRF